MDATVSYTREGYLSTRFYDHLCLGLFPQIQAHNKNLLERIGDIGLWPAENIPRMIRDCVTNPKIITVALTLFAALADSYGFYPEETVKNVQWAISFLPEIPRSAIHFGVYLSTIEFISSCGARAYGRFSNIELMHQFYNENPVKQQ